MSVGEVAKLSGLTIRTLQHYDNIGVLPASGRSENGRRYYTEQDMTKLQHIVFYRGLGFSLDEIKEHLLDSVFDEAHTKKLLAQQKILLYNQIATIQNSIAALEASQEIVSAGSQPPWNLLTVFMKSLGKVDIGQWQDYEFDEELTAVVAENLPTLEDVIEFYNTWKKLSIKAAAYQQADMATTSQPAKQLAREWREMIRKATGDNPENEAAYLQVDDNRETWNPAEKELIEKAEPYLEAVLENE